jgi:CRISPR-associated endonuclease/helicase Cas3
MKQIQARPGQLLTTHLINVGSDTGQFLAAINGPIDLGKLTGYLHDLGKFSPAWQNYLHQSSAGTWQHDRIPHAIHGALQTWNDWAEDSKALALAMSLPIAGHHGGLSNAYGDNGLLAKLTAKQDQIKEIPAGLPIDFDQLLDDTINSLYQDLSSAHNWLCQGDFLAMSLKIRYLFGALVACDRNDAANCSRTIPQSPSDYPAGTEGLDILWQKLATKVNGLTPKNDIDLLRAEFWQECTTGQHQPGWIAVKGPCGVGKTYSLMGLSLTHALQHQKRRVIYCAPFNTILDQTLIDYQSIFGDSVIGHFCSVEPDDPQYHDAFTQQWRHPIIVTSMVQLFESLFSHRATPSRKLANIANSVIVLDEVQSLPTNYLSPILAVLQGLIDHLGCTVVLSTATLPNYERWQINPQSAIDQVSHYYQKLTRVNYHQRGQMAWMDIAAEISTIDRPQVLIGVQTVAAARDAYAALIGETPVMMLTAKMPPIHRQEVLTQIKTKLDSKSPEPILLVATTCIQAGVNISFPVGYFEQVSIDGLIQFAGRVNRSGEYGDRGDVHIFKTTELYNLPPGDLHWRQAITAAILHLGQDLNNDQAIEEFTKRLFDKANTDEEGIIPMLAPDKLKFRDASDAFNIITPTIPVLVCPAHHRATFDQAMQQRDWATLNRFSVGFYSQQVQRCMQLLQPIDANKPELGYVWIGEYDFGPVMPEPKN